MSDDSMKWKVDIELLLREVMNNPGTAILNVPMNILLGILQELAQRAIEINDKELNKIMIRLALYEDSHSQKMMDYLKI